MSYQSRAYDNEHGDPVVVLVVTGSHDVSRLVNVFQHGNCEQWSLGKTITRQVQHHNVGRAALKLLRDHGGPDFTGEADEVADLRARYAELLRLCDHVDHAVGHLPDPSRTDMPGGLIRTERVRRVLRPQPEAVSR